MSLRILVVEDEPILLETLAYNLNKQGYQVLTAADGYQAIALARKERPALLVLDLMLPGVDGLTVCRAMRRQGPNTDTPVLMITARGEEADTVLGLETGADDYLAKPFGVREFMARVRALLRRPRAAAVTPVLADGGRAVRVHGVDIDPAKRRVVVRGAEVELTAQEFRLLHLLATHPGIVFSREALVARVWPDNTFVTPRSVDTLVKRLRKRIEIDTEAPTLVLTVWGAGYKFADV